MQLISEKCIDHLPLPVSPCNMAKLTCVYRLDDPSGITFGKRQLPLAAFMDTNLMVIFFDRFSFCLIGKCVFSVYVEKKAPFFAYISEVPHRNGSWCRPKIGIYVEMRVSIMFSFSRTHTSFLRTFYSAIFNEAKGDVIVFSSFSIVYVINRTLCAFFFPF